MQKTSYMFLLGICAAALVAWLVSLSGIWQLVLLAGIIAGLINKSVKRGGFSGAIGVFITWLLILVVKLLTQNTISLLNAFIGLLGLDIGWLLVIIILIFGFLFGLLGGILGGSLFQLIINADTPENPENK